MTTHSFRFCRTLAAAIIALGGPPSHAALIAHWTFDEVGAAVAKDAAGSYHGKLTGDAALMKDDGRGVAKFTGNGAIIVEGGRGLFNQPAPFSLELVVKPTAENDGKAEPFLLGKPSFAWGLSYFRQGQVYGYIGAGSNNVRAIEDNGIPLGEYSHIVMTYDPNVAGTNLCLYINGHLVAAKPSAQPLPASDVDVVIGQPGFAGMIDEARIYSHALTPKEVTDNMKQVRSAASAAAPIAPPLPGDWRFVPLDNQYNASADLPAGRANMEGAPFQFQAVAPNLIRRAENAAVNEQRVELFGAKVSRANFIPIARADRIEVPIGQKCREAFLCLVAEFPKMQHRYEVPTVPFALSDVESFAIELDYGDGDPDFAFPYALADGGYVIRRIAGAYAVAADPKRELKRLVLHNKRFGFNAALAAVTLNVAAKPALPALHAEPATPPLPAKSPSTNAPPKLIQGGEHILVLAHLWGELTLDLRRIVRVEGHAPCAVESLDVTARAAHAVLVTGKLRLELACTLDPAGQVVLGLKARNEGDVPLRAEIQFPCLEDVTLGSVADTWLFFPKTRHVVTHQRGTYRAPNDRSFPHQFMDIYNPRAGYGLAILTHNLQNAVLDYSLAKNENGVTAFVAYPADWWELKPGETRDLIETCIIPHAGDWHAALALYRQWVATWYQDRGARDADWFRRAFLLKSLVSSAHDAGYIHRTPPCYDRATQTWRVEDWLEADRQQWGALPDTYQFYNWFYDEDRQHEMWGDYAEASYAWIGGLPRFRSAIENIQNKHKTPASVYLIADRCSKDTEIGKKIGKEVACVRKDGSLEADDKMYSVCPGAKPWFDHMVATVKRVQAETGCDSMYLDVFGFSRGLACYSTKHDHIGPLNANQATADFLQAVRAALPATVPIYCEFPLPDTSSQFMDGNIAYYYLTLQEMFGTARDLPNAAPQFAEMPMNLYRFVFPRVKQLCFPVGIEGDPNFSGLKALFFNGEAHYDATWRLYDDRTLGWLKQCLALKKQYTDCFTSDRPSPFVPTLRAGVVANEFPGKGRTLWTIFNGQYRTLRGAVLRVKHLDGATYHDAWNDKPLAPKIENGGAVLSLKLDPQGLGCVVQTRSPKRNE